MIRVIKYPNKRSLRMMSLFILQYYSFLCIL